MTPTNYCCVYRFFDAHDRLLYVGVAGSPLTRFGLHGKDKPWFTTVAAIRLAHCASRGEALRREKALIVALRPPYNYTVNMPHAPTHIGKSHCSHGYELTDENTYVNANGWRQCLDCRE